MAKEKPKEDPFAIEYVRKLTNQELQSLHMDVIQSGGWEKFLESRNVVRLDKNGTITALRSFDGISMKLIEAIPGTGITYYEDLLYSLWCKIEKQLKLYQYGLEQSKKQNS